MKIAGIQKLTLIDYPGTLATTIFTHGCNFKCSFCHNSEIVECKTKVNLLTEAEILKFLDIRKNKLDGLVITGGEPLIHPDLPEFIKKARKFGYKIKVDTNGSYPEHTEKLINMGIVDYWAMDIKADEPNYKKISSSNIKIENIKKSIDLIRESGAKYEFRTTLVKGLHKKSMISGIGNLIKGAPKYYIQNFKPGKTLNKKLDKHNSFNTEELTLIKQSISKYVEQAIIRN